ncbi:MULTISPECIES: dimethylargininase [Actinoplanes]|uniref:dimethylargininase n=1 Tax=Actinoplanes TaxID=1865 RepID=UPI0005F297EB|nr:MULTISPECIES: dimethylargininase [Actinoplanes]GLY03855.1 amidinotransferase [Actinoplanes sp. NBRC 101535]
MSRRAVRPRRYLMCRPAYFDVVYSINPWMDPSKPSDTELAVLQWERLYRLYRTLGHRVDLIEPGENLPDMVFAANGATVVDGRVLVSRFRHEQRVPEGAAYERWFRDAGFDEVLVSDAICEGEGDLLTAGEFLLAGTGFRTDRAAHVTAFAFLRKPVVPLTLVDDRFYHLDTALAVLDDDEVVYFPDAFSADSRRVLRRLYPDAILATEADAEAFGLNAVSDGRHVVLPEAAVDLAGRLADRGFEPIGMDVSELHKAGGAVKCCTLELRGRVPVAD